MSDVNLIRLAYASTATFNRASNELIEPEVARILMQSKRNNAREEIGGVLHFGNGYFFQCLEGEKESVESLYHRIVTDSRHEKSQILHTAPIDMRWFPDWSMKYVEIEKEVGRILEKYDLATFNPYQFDQPIINDLLRACVAAVEPIQAARLGDKPEKQQEKKKSVWSRLFGD